jgi:phasin
MRDARATAAATTFASPPKTEAPQPIREIADSFAHPKESYEKMSAAATEASSVIQNACSTAAQSAMDCNAKVIEFARTNSNAAFDYARELLAVKSPSDFLKVATENARKQYETLSEQSKELTALSKKVMTEMTGPLQAGAKPFRGPLV